MSHSVGRVIIESFGCLDGNVAVMMTACRNAGIVCSGAVSVLDAVGLAHTSSLPINCEK